MQCPRSDLATWQTCIETTLEGYGNHGVSNATEISRLVDRVATLEQENATLRKDMALRDVWFGDLKAQVSTARNDLANAVNALHRDLSLRDTWIGDLNSRLRAVESSYQTKGPKWR